MIIIESHSICNEIGESGATSLSESLKVNSSLTHLDLTKSLLSNMSNWLFFNNNPFLTILETQEQHQYQKHWRSIHHSLNWTCGIEFIIEYDWLIIIESHFICNEIGDSGLSSLSEALKVNSSLTHLDIYLSLWLNVINCL